MATIVRSTHVSECPAGVTLSSSDQGVMNMQPTTSHQPHRKIVPFRIPSDDQPNLPGPGPTFQTSLTLDRRQNISMHLAINQPMQLISPGKSRSQTPLMRPDATSQIARNTKIQRPVRTIGHDIYPGTIHSTQNTCQGLRKGLRRDAVHAARWSLPTEVVGGQAKPGHDVNVTIGPGPNISIGPGPSISTRPGPNVSTCPNPNVATHP
jgi:hypothetical protein